MSTWLVVAVLALAFLGACWLVGVFNRLTDLRRQALASQAQLMLRISLLDPAPPGMTPPQARDGPQPRAAAAWAQLLRLLDPSSSALLHPTQSQALDAAWGIWANEVSVPAWLQANGAASTVAQQARQSYLEQVQRYNLERDLWPARAAAWVFGFRRAGVARALLDNGPSS